jgi:hypothetical protein
MLQPYSRVARRVFVVLRSDVSGWSTHLQLGDCSCDIVFDEVETLVDAPCTNIRQSARVRLASRGWGPMTDDRSA